MTRIWSFPELLYKNNFLDHMDKEEKSVLKYKIALPVTTHLGPWSQLHTTLLIVVPLCGLTQLDPANDICKHGLNY